MEVNRLDSLRFGIMYISAKKKRTFHRQRLKMRKKEEKFLCHLNKCGCSSQSDRKPFRALAPWMWRGTQLQYPVKSLRQTPLSHQNAP